ncbi:MAG: TonB family protein [Phycisphaeraceae bacterium]
MAASKSVHFVKEAAHRVMVGGGAVGLTLAFFMVLPLMQAISKPPGKDMIDHGAVNTGQLEEPKEPPKVEEEKPPEKEPDPPKLADEPPPPVSLEQLDLALDTGVGTGGFLAGDFSPTALKTIVSQSETSDALFGIDELDQKPRVISQASPTLNAEIRRKAPGTVYVIFVVDQTGRVVDPQVQRSSDAVFEKAALSAVKQWKFEPGKRNGQPVRFRMRVPITFPKG